MPSDAFVCAIALTITPSDTVVETVLQSASLSAVSMLREAVNLSPDAKQVHAPASHSDDAQDSTDSETDTPVAPPQSCYLAQSGSQDHWQQHQQQQGQEAGRATYLLREAYKEMLLQQYSRHRTELDRRQAKYQRQLDAQVD